MERTIFTSLKVNNEIELCEVSDTDCKTQIERALLANRISYFVKWVKPRFLHRRREICIFCINENDRELAEHAIRSLGPSVEKRIDFLMSKSENDFF